MLALSVGRIWGRSLGHQDTVKKCCDSRAWMEHCQIDEVHQWEEKTHCNILGNTIKKRKVKFSPWIIALY